MNTKQLERAIRKALLKTQSGRKKVQWKEKYRPAWWPTDMPFEDISRFLQAGKVCICYG
jgi:hypothetical protein